MKSIFLLSIFLVTLVKLLGQSPLVSYQKVNSNDNEVFAVGLIASYVPIQLLNEQSAKINETRFINNPEEYQSTKKNLDTKSIKRSKKGNSKYLVRSTLGSNGISKTIVTNSGNFIYRHSIGQKSVIGTFTNGKYTIRQGFQQPLNSGEKVQILPENQLNAKLYPNPFQQSLNVSFDEKISNDLIVVIYNLPGKVLFSKKYPASQQLTLPLSYLTKGNYILKITTDNKQLLAKLIKL